jgi:hypothetical protein
VVVSVDPAKTADFENFLTKKKVAFSKLGEVVADEFIIDNDLFFSTEEASEMYNNILASYLA